MAAPLAEDMLRPPDALAGGTSTDTGGYSGQIVHFSDVSVPHLVHLFTGQRDFRKRGARLHRREIRMHFTTTMRVAYTGYRYVWYAGPQSQPGQ